MRMPLSARSEGGLTLRRFSRLRFVSLICIAQMTILPLVGTGLRAQTANVIIPDGRTGTSLQTSGNVTNITTTTVSGANAFNSFSQFGVGQGNTVNLQVPNGSQNLINIVRDAPAYVNGTLNSYQNGKIGGNVYFADPYGFVVGKTGVVNVGSLNVSTPSKEFTDSIIGASGQINNAAVSSLMNGSFPISPDGNIRILGRINAADGVRLTGQNVFVGGGRSQRERVNQEHASKFAASVNSKGLRSASAITVRNGSIHIGAVNNATISGRLTARSRTTTPSTITVTAGNNIQLGKTASLSTASKTGDAGNITLKATSDLTVKSGARINASSATGNAAVVDLSANGIVEIANGVKINVAAPNGNAGKLILDPTDIVVGATEGVAGVNMSNATVAAAISALNGTGTFTLLASNSITINGNGVVDGGTAVNVTLNAPTLNLLAGSYVRGDTVALTSTTSGGQVNINAASNGGAQILTNTALQITASRVVLSSAANMIVGNGSTSSNTGAAGFVSNATIARYAGAVGSGATLSLSAASQITVDSTGIVDGRRLAGAVSNANSVDQIVFTAPTINIDSGGQVLVQAVNAGGTSYTSGRVIMNAFGAGSGINLSGTVRGGFLGFSTDQASITVGSTAVLAGDPSRYVNFNGPSISVNTGASISAGTVGFFFAQSALTVGGASLTGGNVAANNGQSGQLSNLMVARYIAAVNGSGTLLLSAQANTLNLNADAVINAGSTMKVALQARTLNVTSGAQITAGAAAFAFDQDDVIIGSSADPSAGSAGFVNNTQIASLMLALSGTSAFEISANNSITLNATAVIDSRSLNASQNSQANSRNVTLSAPTITMAQGSKILAQAVNFGGSTFTSGAVTLNASASDNRLSGQATAVTGITIDGQITGGHITINATSTAVSSFTSSILGMFALVGESVAPALLGLNGGYVAASATATVNINSHANINGTGRVLISANGSELAEDPVLAGLVNFMPFSAAVVVGKIDANVSTNVASGATISAGSNLSILATNDATMKVSAVSAGSAQFVETVAYSKVSVATLANVATGANISVGTVNASGNTFAVRALNNNSFSTSATSVALSTPSASGGVGGALAISDITTSATALLGASLGTSANRLNGSVVVEATSNGKLNSTMASTIVGTPALVGALQEAILTTVSPQSMIFAMMGPLVSASFNFKSAGAMSLANSTQNATAAIKQNPSGGAPSIYTNGNVAVVSNVIDVGVRSNATASAITSDVSAGEGVAISAAVAWGTFNHNSNAYIGGGTLINAPNIGVAANTYLPITNTWLQWAGLGEVISHLNGNLGVGGNILTSYANATSDAGDTVGIAGSLNNFMVNNNTTAWVATGASLNATCTIATCGNGAWSASTWSGTQDFNATLAIAANTSTSSINAAGNVGTLGFLPGNTSGGSSLGGALNLVQFSSNTIAGVASGASLSASDNISIDAVTTDLFFGVAPTSGKAAGALSLNGITSIALVNNKTHASIGIGAHVSSPTVNVHAAQDLSMLSIAGAVSLGGASAVGIAVAYLGANTDTAAYIGENQSDIRPGPFSTNDPSSGSGGGNGTIAVDHLAVSATTSGRMTAASIAAAISEPSVSDFANKAGAVGAAATGGADGVGIAMARISQSSGASSDGFSIDIAGSSSISDVSLGTKASIAGVTINRFTGSSTGASTLVQALNDTVLNNGSGSAAANLAGSAASGSVAVAGAIAVAMSNNATVAYIDNTTINNHAAVSVQALNGGSETVVAIGIAASRANSVAIALSVGIITDSVNAYIQNSTLNGVSSGMSRAVEVDAYQTSNIAIGGGSLYVAGGQGGVGAGFTYASIGDPTGGTAVDAHIRGTSINGYDTLTVLGDNASVIAAGAASGGAGGNGAAGAIVVTDITTSTMAYIRSSATVNITVTGNVIVTADSVAIASLDTALSNLVKASNANQLASDNCSTTGGQQNCVDFSYQALNGGTAGSPTAPGAAIIAVAGIIQAGKNNVGASMVYDHIATTHSAYIAGVLLTSTNGTVSVTASDSSEIQSVAIGFGLSTGQFSGVGGLSINSIQNTVTASIGNAQSTTTNSTITAANLFVTANDTSKITGTAAVAGGSTQGSAAGLSLVYSDISNNLSAGITGSKVVSSGNVGVSTKSDATISTVAVGVAISSQIGLAGSVATNLMGTNVTASITGGADVIADGSIAVQANNTDNAAVFAGAFAISKGAAGGAGSLVTNKITGNTSAYISGSATKVDARGNSTQTAGPFSVNSGTLAHALDLGAFSAPTDDTPDLSETRENVRGLSVNASSHQAVVANVASLAASSGVSIMINPIVNVMSGTTSAYIDSASIDTRLTSSTLTPQINVAASSISYSGTFGLGIVAPTGTAGGGATIISTTMSRETFAYITNAAVGGTVNVGGVISPTVGAVTVKANAEQHASSVAVGFNSGSVGLNVFNATTQAYVDGGSLTASSLSVKAKNSTGIASANGSGAYGSNVAIGAAFLVQVSSNKTLAYVGDEFHYRGNSAAHTTALQLSGALDVDARTINDFQAFSVGGAISTGGGAVAGMANIEIANNTTIAGIYDTTLTSPTGTAAGAVTVNANEEVYIREIAGALSVATGGVGVGAAANVLVFKSQTTAETRNSNLNSSGAINVNAQSIKEVQSYAVTVGAGSSVGIGAAIGVILIGTNTADADTQGDQTGQFGGTITAANAGTNSSQGSGAVASGTAGNPSGANATSTYDVSTVLTGGNDSVTAQIAGGNVTGTQVNVSATSANAAQQFLLGAGFGKNVGIGAGIGYTTVNSSVLANLSAIVSAPTVSVAAVVKDATTGPYAGKTVDTESIAGGLSLYFGAQAAVAVGNVSNTVTAQLGGTVTGTGGNGVQVTARDTSTQAATAGGGSGGIAAIGVTIATTAKSSSVAAKILDNASVSSSTVAVTASEAGELSASATAVAGGIVSGTGAAATAKEDSTVLAEIGSSAAITTSSTGLGTLVSASATPDVSATSLGVAVGGGAIGVSVALASSSLNVTSRVGNSTTFSGGDVSVTAMALAPSSGNGIYARAIAGGGGSLIGVQGSYAETRENSTVSAYGGTGITLPDGDFIIAAQNDSNQYATATGIAAGYVAAGATISKVTSNATTDAYLGAGAITTANHIGILQITAVGTDSLASSATAGSGGTIAGAAAVALINDTATTSANLYGNATSNTLYLGGLNIQAQHQTNYAGNGDAFQASFAGASGGNATNNITSTTTAGVGTNLIIHSAGGDMLVISNDIVNQVGGGARAGSGGVAAGAATVSDAHVTQRSTTNIGSGTILSLNDDPLTSTAKVNIEAYNSLRTVDSVSLTAGGLFAGGGARSNMTANAYATVNIDATEIFSAGNLFIGTASSLIAYNYANANLYGAITGAGASTNTSLTANQAINVSGDTTLLAWGLLNLTAGQAGDGSKYSQVSANATTVVYNQALVPITAVYSGTATARSYTDLNIAGGAQVLGVNNVSLAATKGAVSANGRGTNYNPYLTLFSTENHDNHSDATQVRGNISQNGVVVAGIYNQQSILIAVGANVPTLTTTSPYALTLELVSDPNNFSTVKKYNHQTIQYAVVNGFNPYQTIVSQIATLSGLSTADVQTVLSGANPTITIAAANDPTGDIQRQVNTLIQQAPFAANVAGASIALGDIMVSGGNVSILADTMSGTQVAGKAAPRVSSRDSVSINIENQGLNFMSVSRMTVTGVSGGHNIFTGAATDTTSPGITFQQDLTGSTPVVTVNASYNRKDPNTGLGVDLNGIPLTKTPDIYFNGEVTNLNGLLNISNALGNVVASKTYNAATIQVQVPNGTFTFNGGVGSIYNTNGIVSSQWAGVQFRPTETLTAVMTAATWLGTYGQYVPGEVYIAGNGTYKPYTHYCCNGGSGSAAAVPNSVVFTARMLNLFYDGVSLYSAIFLPSGEGIPGNLAQIEGANPAIVSTRPWEKSTYDGQTVYGDNGSPFHCSGCAAFFQVINIQSAAVTPVTAATTLTAAAPNAFAIGKAIILSASVLNVNGTIQSGQSSNYSVNIGTNARNVIDSLRADTLANLSLAQAQSNAQNGNYLDLTPYLTKVNGGDVQVGARYNVLTDQIVLNSVVQGTGGYVYLNGRIISTSTSGTSQGNIVVNGGAGTITVNNTTGTTLVTNTINTGVSAASVIQIVDQLKQQTTWYVYNAAAPGGQQVSTYRTAGVNASGYNSGMLVGLSGTSGVVYQPLANQYYQWVDTATLTRPVTSTAADYGWTFSGVSANSPTYPYTQTTSLVSNVMQVVNGVTTNQLQTANFQEVVTATGGYHSNNFNTSSGACCGSIKQYNWYQMIYDSLTLKLTNTVKASYDIGIHFNGGGASSVAVTSDASIVINGPINNLQGATTVTATGANSSITVGATANNPLISGTNVTLTADGGIGSLAGTKTPVPVQVYGGRLNATSIDRDIAIAAQGSLVIGQVKVNSATPGSAPQGNIFLSATGDINSGSPYNFANPVVVGKSIEINSTGGAIGAISSVSNGATVLTNVNPLVVQATGTTLVNGSVDGGVLDSTSSTGTYIVQSSGDLRLGKVSSGGAVFLAAAASDGQTANILNGLSAGGLTAEQSAHLQSVWTDLNLVSGSAAASVTAYESMIKAAYNDYWQLRNLAFADGNTYALTSLGTTVLKAQVAAKLGIDPADVSTTQMMTEATTRFERAEYLLGIKTAAQLSNSLTTLFGANLASNATLQAAPDLTVSLTAYNPNFSYSLSTSSTLYATITSGSQWTQDQLKYTVSAAANPATAVAPAPIGELTPANVSGRQVMLYAPNGSVGNLARPEDFSFTSSTGSSTLSDVQKALLASAGPSQLTVTPTTDQATGVITYNVSVSQQSYVVLNPIDAVAAKVQSDIYLASKSDLKLGGIANATFGPITAARTNGVQIVGVGDVKLDAVGNIFAGIANQPVISGNIRDLTLISETGNIGQAPAAGSNPANNPNALQIAFDNPSTNQLDQVVAAQGGIYLKQTTGDLVLGNVTAAGAIQFAATGSIYAQPQFTDRTAVHIAGGSLDVRAGGNVGFNGATAQPLQVKISGAITGTSVGAMTILAPSDNLNIGTTGTYGGLSAGGAMTLRTPVGALNINADVTSDGLMQLLANGAVTFSAGTSADPIVAESTNGAVTLASASLTMGAYTAINAAGVITVATTGDATLGQLNSSASFAAAGNAASIVISAGGVSAGAILSNADGQTNLVASGANARVALNASSIGTSTQRITLNAPYLAATATDGGIYIGALADLEASLLSAVKGSVDVQGSGSLTLNNVLAGTATGANGTFTARATTSGSNIVVGSAASSGSQTLHADGNVTFNQLSATGVGSDPGDITVNADHGFVLAQTVVNGGVTTPGSVVANGSASLTAATTITGMTLAATTGSASLQAAGLIDWTTLTAGTTLGMTSTAGSITLKTAQSGGSQILHASQNITFNQLATTGITGDVGNININADNGFILAETVVAGGVTTPGSVAANGSASLTAATIITGTTLAATTGSASLQATGLIDWATLTAGTTLGINSTGSSITLKTARSGGSQTLHANQNVTFNQLAANGISGDAGNINVNADNGFILAETVVAGGVTTPGSVAANGSASLTAATTIAGTSLTATTGSASLLAAGLIDWTALTAGTTLGINSTGSSITLKTAQSGGSQTLHANQNVTFNQLAANGITGDVGNINVNAANGFILAETVVTGGVTTPGSVTANGSASLTAATTITGTALAATTGSASLQAAGLIDWTALTAGTTLGVNSTGSSIALKTAQSGGTQTLHARQNVTFDQLTTSGITGDAGNVNINADTGKLAGGSINAHGSARLIAATTNTGVNLTTVTGGALLQGTLIDWANLQVAGALGITATTGGITLGTAISGGTQTLQAHGDIVFKQLTANGIPGDAGDVNLRSDFGSILGGSVYANGDTHFDTAGSISLDQIRGNTVALSAPGDLTIKWVGVVKQLDLAANTINVVGGQIPSTPSIPLIMNVTGYKGGVATSANLNIDPDTIIVNQFRVVDANFVTDAPNVTIVNGFVPGQLMLTTLTQRILLDNRSPSPSNWATLQLYQPSGVFTMSHNGNANVTDSYVVLYNGDISATVTNYVGSHTCCSNFTGSMAIRNIANDTEGTETLTTWLAQKSGAETFYLLGLAGNARLEALLTPKPVEVIGSGPAVNIEGLTEARKLRQLHREGRKNSRPGWNSTGLDGRAKGNANRFADARENGNPVVQF
ncbi:leukotoxin LktA family filamentous adhesin [Bradyrhizobium sp. AUGA SZCCT0222]|uniref:leukotoxin LktA family filamentous adhesin n=1 Tax=Bradyrhizobium sp. AUGA SZCCT0222 TaxID=2807668 RepID=UPI001BADB666|nr:leukotoxin LktA family filamentous adhesin [Bradyrhizobium sp. AUGA SZCCT0222]MBR1266082.1 leukotoxin LktA family filamentous adhesin [Bradyrhizobium sp. AUGA SZCCT0222]